MLAALVNYAIHLIASGILLGVFFAIYTRVTPFDELGLIRAGNSAAMLSLGSALIGFSLTLGSAIVHNATLLEVVLWAVAALIVQLIVFIVASRVLPAVRTGIEAGNVAMGGFLGSVSLVAGIVNAACLS